MTSGLPPLMLREICTIPAILDAGDRTGSWGVVWGETLLKNVGLVGWLASYE